LNRRSQACAVLTVTGIRVARKDRPVEPQCLGHQRRYAT
jgi:hypothetical protein